jgi:hypothetical protein
MMFYPTTVHAEEEDTATIMGRRAPKKTRTTGRSWGRVMALVAGLTLLLVAEGAVVMPEEKEEDGAWSDAGSTTRSAAAATAAAAEEGVVMTKDVQEIPSSRHYDFAAVAGDGTVGTEDGSRIHELTPRHATAAAADAAAATTQRRRKIAKKTHEVLSGGSTSCSKSKTHCPRYSDSGYRIIMTVPTNFKCTVTEKKQNKYWLKWSRGEYNHPHSTITKGKYGYARKHHSHHNQDLSYIDGIIKAIAHYPPMTTPYKFNGPKPKLSFTFKSGLTYATYSSGTINRVSERILSGLPSVSDVTLQYKDKPYLHFTLGDNHQQNPIKKTPKLEYKSQEYDEIVKCIKDQKTMNLVIQNIDNECWCKTHRIYEQ